MKAILTGHSRGLGASIAAELLSRHIPVLGLARGRNAELEKQYPDLLEQVELDMSESAALARWLARGDLQKFLGDAKSVLLINNAGLLQPVGPLETQEAMAIARAVSVNVAAPLILSAAVAAATSHVTDRRVLHVSSGAARNAYPGWSVYCATKAALDQHAQAVALDHSPALRICSLAPGVVDTEMQSEIRATSPEKFPLREKFEALKRNGALASPDDCAKRLVDYLLSEHFGTVPVADLRELG
jgi:NADP-dependent 3-hydroxy acid dehydrogenase YdfG